MKNYLEKIVNQSDSEASENDNYDDEESMRKSNDDKRKRKTSTKAVKKSSKGRILFKRVNCSLCEQQSLPRKQRQRFA